jgi:hypothetical protein
VRCHEEKMRSVHSAKHSRVPLFITVNRFHGLISAFWCVPSQ